jgi:hypothetical protein
LNPATRDAEDWISAEQAAAETEKAEPPAGSGFQNFPDQLDGRQPDRAERVRPACDIA